MISFTVQAFESGGLAMLEGVSFVCTFRANEFDLLALVSAVGVLITFETLCDWTVFLNVYVVVGYDLGKEFDAFLCHCFGLLARAKFYFNHMHLCDNAKVIDFCIVFFLDFCAEVLGGLFQ